MITRGVYSATCSILNDDYSLNVDATIAHAASTVNNGLHGAIFFGSTGQSQLIDFAFYGAYYLGALFLFAVSTLKGKDIVSVKRNGLILSTIRKRF